VGLHGLMPMITDERGEPQRAAPATLKASGLCR